MPPTPSPRLTLSETAPAIAVSHRKDALCRGPEIPCLTKSKGKGSGTAGAARENFNTGRDPAIGWTSPLPAVRMRAAMLVSAVVATCRGRRRRGAIREDVCWLLTSRTDGVGFSYERCQPDSLRLVPAPMLLRANNCDAFWLLLPGVGPGPCSVLGWGSYRSETATARARTVARACEFEPRVARVQSCSEIKGSPHARRRADVAAMMHR